MNTLLSPGCHPVTLSVRPGHGSPVTASLPLSPRLRRSADPAMQRNTCLTCEDFSESSSRPDGRDRTPAAGPQARVAARPQRVWLVVLEIGHLPELFEVPEIPVPHGPARIWLAARRRGRRRPGIPASAAAFCSKVTVHQLTRRKASEQSATA